MTPDIGVIIQRARKQTVRYFQDVGATSADKAITYQPQRHIERRALAYLIGKGVVVLTDEGRHWVNEEKAAEWLRAMRTQTAFVLGGALAAGAAWFALSRRKPD